MPSAKRTICICSSPGLPLLSFKMEPKALITTSAFRRTTWSSSSVQFPSLSCSVRTNSIATICPPFRTTFRGERKGRNSHFSSFASSICRVEAIEYITLHAAFSWKKTPNKPTRKHFFTKDVNVDSSILEISCVQYADSHLTVSFRASHPIKSTSGSRSSRHIFKANISPIYFLIFPLLWICLTSLRGKDFPSVYICVF